MSDWRDEVWAVLADECGAFTEDDRYAHSVSEFKQFWPECREFRFIGRLGFGGKVWANDGRVYVTCYPEDETPARRTANERLAPLAANLSSVV